VRLSDRADDATESPAVRQADRAGLPALLDMMISGKRYQLCRHRADTSSDTSRQFVQFADSAGTAHGRLADPTHAESYEMSSLGDPMDNDHRDSDTANPT
jgi:hypothetical protein